MLPAYKVLAVDCFAEVERGKGMILAYLLILVGVIGEVVPPQCCLLRAYLTGSACCYRSAVLGWDLTGWAIGNYYFAIGNSAAALSTTALSKSVCISTTQR